MFNILYLTSGRNPNKDTIFNITKASKQAQSKSINLYEIKNTIDMAYKLIKKVKLSNKEKISKKAKNSIKRNSDIYRYESSPKSLSKKDFNTYNSRVECPLGYALNGFHLFEINLRSQKNLNTIVSNSYEFNCFKNKFLTIRKKPLYYKTKKVTINKVDIEKASINKLLNLKVKCPQETLITKFRLAITRKKKIYYRYTCIESDVEAESCSVSQSNKVSLGDKKADKAIPLHVLKKIFVDAPSGRFLKKFQLKLDKKNNEMFYKITSCRVDNDELKEDDQDVDIEPDEEDFPSKDPEEEDIYNTPQDFVNQFINERNLINPISEESESEPESYKKLNNKYEVFTIGKKNHEQNDPSLDEDEANTYMKKKSMSQNSDSNDFGDDIVVRNKDDNISNYKIISSLNVNE